MRPILMAVILSAVASPSHAAIPLVNATCPGNIEIHADAGGPLYVNGKEAKLKVFNDSYYEASQGHVTISLSINPDGTASISYTGQGGANGICSVSDGGDSADGGCPVDVSEADRYKYPACN